MTETKLSNRRLGEVAEEAVIESRRKDGYDVWLLKNGRDNGVDVIAHRRTSAGGAHLEVIEVKANGARLSSLQKAGGEEFLRDRLTIAHHLDAIPEWGKGDRSEVWRSAPDAVRERVSAQEIGKRVEALVADSEARGGRTKVLYSVARVEVDRRTGAVGAVKESFWTDIRAEKRARAAAAALRAGNAKSPNLRPTLETGR